MVIVDDLDFRRKRMPSCVSSDWVASWTHSQYKSGSSSVSPSLTTLASAPAYVGIIALGVVFVCVTERIFVSVWVTVH